MRILMITEGFPFPPTDGVKLKVYHMLKGLSMKHDIFLLSFVDSKLDVNFGEIELFCRQIELVSKNQRSFTLLRTILNIFERTPFSLKPYNSHKMKRRLKKILEHEQFDIVHLDMANTAQFIDLVSHMPTLIAPHDSITLNLKRRSKLEKNFFRRVYQYIQWKKWERYESEMYAKFGKCFVVSDVDKEVLLSLNPEIDIAVAPNGVDVDFYKSLGSKPEKASLIFSGSMGSFQSVDAILYFCETIYGNLKAVMPDLELYIVGKNPPHSVKQLTQDKSITVTGYVEDIRPFIDKSTIYVCPIRSGSGIKNRLLEAMAMSKPIVAFAKSCEALNVTHMKDIWLANNPQEFTRGILTLLDDQALREEIAYNARQLVEREYSWGRSINIIEKSYEEAIRKKKSL